MPYQLAAPGISGYSERMDSTDLAIRSLIYARFGRTGAAPSSAELAADLGKPPAWIAARLARLADERIVVLDERGEILRALPFCAEPTPFVVDAGDVRYFGNCAWDAFGIAALLGPSATIDLRCGDCDRPVVLEPPAIVHFAVPASRWWDDIGDT